MFKFKIIYFLPAQSEIQNFVEDSHVNTCLAEQEARDTESDIHLVEMKHALIKHMYFAQVSERQDCIHFWL